MLRPLTLTLCPRSLQPRYVTRTTRRFEEGLLSIDSTLLLFLAILAPFLYKTSGPRVPMAAAIRRPGSVLPLEIWHGNSDHKRLETSHTWPFRTNLNF